MKPRIKKNKSGFVKGKVVTFVKKGPLHSNLDLEQFFEKPEEKEVDNDLSREESRLRQNKGSHLCNEFE